jgi:hypothetical protein
MSSDLGWAMRRMSARDLNYYVLGALLKDIMPGVAAYALELDHYQRGYKVWFRHPKLPEPVTLRAEIDGFPTEEFVTKLRIFAP